MTPLLTTFSAYTTPITAACAVIVAICVVLLRATWDVQKPVLDAVCYIACIVALGIGTLGLIVQAAQGGNDAFSTSTETEAVTEAATATETATETATTAHTTTTTASPSR